MRKIEFDLEKAKAGAKLITRDGRPVRIVCWDTLGTQYKILALVENIEDEKEEIFTYSIDGKFYLDNDESRLDLFIIEEPNVRPYTNADEFLKDMKEYGSFVKDKDLNSYYAVLEFNDREVFVGIRKYFYSDLKDIFTWQDGSPCGVCEEGTDE